MYGSWFLFVGGEWCVKAAWHVLSVCLVFFRVLGVMGVLGIHFY